MGTQGCTTNSDCLPTGEYCFSTSNGPYFRRADDSSEEDVVQNPQSPINPTPINPQYPTTFCAYDTEGWGFGSLCSGQFGDWSDCNQGQNCNTGTCQWDQYYGSQGAADSSADSSWESSEDTNEMRRAEDSQSYSVQNPQIPSYPNQGCTTNSDCLPTGEYCFSTSNGPYFRRADDSSESYSVINPQIPINPQYPTTICGYDPQGWGVGSLCSGQFGDWSDCNQGQNCETGTCQWNQYYGNQYSSDSNDSQ